MNETNNEREETVTERIRKEALPLILEGKSFKKIVRELAKRGYSESTVKKVVKPMLDAKRKAAELLLSGKTADFVMDKLTKQGYLRDYVEPIVKNLHEKILKELNVKALLEEKIREAKEKESETVLMTINELQAILNYINELEDTAKRLQEELIKARREVEEYKKRYEEELPKLRERVERRLQEMKRKEPLTDKQRIYLINLFSKLKEDELEEASKEQASILIDYVKELLERRRLREMGVNIPMSPHLEMEEKIRRLAELKGVSVDSIISEIIVRFKFYPDSLMPPDVVRKVLKWLDEEITRLKSEDKN